MWYAGGACPSNVCGQPFWVVAFVQTNTDGSQTIKEAYVNPDFMQDRIPAVPADAFPEERIHKAYSAVYDIFNKGALSAVPNAVGRTLEGIVKEKLKSSGVDVGKKRMLGPLLELMADEVELAQPLHDLAGALKDGRNIGSHFDDEIDPSPEMAEKMLEMLEVIVEYLYVMPKQIEELRAFVRASSQEPEAPPSQ